MLTVRSDNGRLEFDPGAGTYAVFSSDAEIFANATGLLVTRVRTGKKVGFETHSTSGSWETLESAENTLSVFKRLDWGRLLFRARGVGDALVLELGILWEAEDEPPGVESLAPLVVPPGGIWPGRESLKPWRVYVNGWQCWSPSGVVKSKRAGDYLFPLFLPRFLKPMLANTATPISSERGRFEGEWFAALGDIERSDSVVVGFTGVSRALSQVSVRLGRRTEQSGLRATARFEGKRAERHREFWSEPLVIIPGDLSGGNLELYAEMVAAEQGVKETRRSPSGWSSRCQYFRGVTSEDVRSNLDLLSDKFAGLGLELVQVDDGYQTGVGDWLETNDNFPEGMKEVAEEIRNRGKVPGIWVAPFTATNNSKLFTEHRDWLVKRRRNRPALAGASVVWRSRFYGLDLTNPEVLEHIREVFTTLAGYGYRFFKLDFLATGMIEGRRHDESLTRAEAMRRALAVIREAVGDESLILSAGGPILLGTGIIDTQRVGPDVAPTWRPFYQAFIRDRATPGVRNCLIGMLTRCFMNGRPFEADPDCLMLRASETKLNRDETRTLASAVAVFGGALLISDDLGSWGPEQETIAERLMPRVSAKPRCPDLWRNEVPRFMVSTLEDPFGEYRLVWVINWAGKKRDIEVKMNELGLEAGRYHACEFWSARYLGEVRDSFLLEGLPPHGSAVVRLTPEGEGPLMLGSNVHISQGAAELSGAERTENGVNLTLRSPVLPMRKAIIVLRLPERPRTAPPDVDVSDLGGSVFRLEFKLQGVRELNLSWQQETIMT